MDFQQRLQQAQQLSPNDWAEYRGAYPRPIFVRITVPEHPTMSIAVPVHLVNEVNAIVQVAKITNVPGAQMTYADLVIRGYSSPNEVCSVLLEEKMNNETHHAIYVHLVDDSQATEFRLKDQGNTKALHPGGSLFRGAVYQGEAFFRSLNANQIVLRGYLVTEPDMNQLNNVNMNQPNMGQPNMNQLNMNQPNMNQLNMGQPNMNQPNMNQLNMNQPNMNQPNMNQLNMNQPNMNQPNMNQLNMNQPNMNQPNMGQPNMNQPEFVRLTIKPKDRRQTAADRATFWQNLIRGVVINGQHADLVPARGGGMGYVLGTANRAQVDYDAIFRMLVKEDWTSRDFPSGLNTTRHIRERIKRIKAWAGDAETWRHAQGNGNALRECPVPLLHLDEVELLRIVGTGPEPPHQGPRQRGALSKEVVMSLRDAHLQFLLHDPIKVDPFWKGVDFYDSLEQPEGEDSLEQPEIE